MKKLLIITTIFIFAGHVSAAESHTSTSLPSVEAVPVLHEAQTLSPHEIGALSELSERQQDGQDLSDMTGGADKRFWKAAALGGLVVLLVVVIF